MLCDLRQRPRSCSTPTSISELHRLPARKSCNSFRRPATATEYSRAVFRLCRRRTRQSDKASLRQHLSKLESSALAESGTCTHWQFQGIRNTWIRAQSYQPAATAKLLICTRIDSGNGEALKLMPTAIMLPSVDSFRRPPVFTKKAPGQNASLLRSAWRSCS